MERFPEECNGKDMIILDIQDDYQYMDEELIEEINAKTGEYL